MLQTIRDIPFDLAYNYDYLSLVAISFVFHLSVYRIMSPYLSKKLSLKYPNLSINNKIEWNVRSTSTTFSIIVSFLCLYILIADKGISKSPLYYESSLVKLNLAIVMGYALADMIIIICNYKVIGDAFTLVHHCISLYGYSNSLGYSVMPYFANLRLIVELSTPLVNMRWFMYACGYPKDSLHFFFNGILMTLVFFTVRIALIPVYWYKVYTVLDSPLWATMRSFRYIMIFTCIALDVINIYWFRKMFKGALIVWTANWQYYERHHKAKQLETLSNYGTKLRSKLALLNSIVPPVYQSSVDFLHRLQQFNYTLPSTAALANLVSNYDFISFSNNATPPHPTDEHQHEARMAGEGEQSSSDKEKHGGTANSSPLDMPTSSDKGERVNVAMHTRSKQIRQRHQLHSQNI